MPISNNFWDKDGRPIQENSERVDFSLYDLDKEAETVREAEIDFVETLGDLQLTFFTDYCKITEDVSCSTYSNGTKVYVNRGNADWSNGNVTVPAKGFVRI